MKLTLKRIALKEGYTIGKMYVNGAYFCDTLEDTTRDLNKNGILDEGKIYGETSIPYGTYKVIMSYSPRLGRNLPRLLNVPGFEGVLIHRGNTASDTLGCILVGENKVKGKVINSTQYELSLVDKCNEAIRGGETIDITIQ